MFYSFSSDKFSSSNKELFFNTLEISFSLSLLVISLSTIWAVLKIVLVRMPQIVNDSDITSKDKEKEISNVLKKSSLLELENLSEEKL